MALGALDGETSSLSSGTYIRQSEEVHGIEANRSHRKTSLAAQLGGAAIQLEEAVGVAVRGEVVLGSGGPGGGHRRGTEIDGAEALAGESVDRIAERAGRGEGVIEAPSLAARSMRL